MLEKKYKNEYDYLYRNDKTNGKKLQNYKLIHKQITLLKFEAYVFNG